MSINPNVSTDQFLGTDMLYWFGTVVNNDSSSRKSKDGNQTDKSLSAQVRILGYHSHDIKDEDLPWAIVLQPTSNPAFGGISGSGHSYLLPGTFVFGFFLDGRDCQQPVISHTLYGAITTTNGTPAPRSCESYSKPGSENTVTFSNDKTDIGTPSQTDAIKESVDSVTSSMSLVGSPSNPLGTFEISVANGVTGPNNTYVDEIIKLIEELFNVFKTGIVYQPNSTLVEDINATQQYIQVSNSSSFPPKGGKVRINSEIIGYSGINEYSLVLCKRGMENTTPSSHTRGTSVEFIPDVDSAIQVYSRYVNKIVDVQKIIQRILGSVRNLIWYLVNQLKAYLMTQVNLLLSSVTTALISAIPYNVKLVADAILTIINLIGCSIDEAIVDNIMNGIQSFIESYVTQLLNGLINLSEDFTNSIEECANNIFGSILELASIGTIVLDTIQQVQSLVSTFGSLGGISITGSDGNLNPEALNNVANVVGFLLNLLGIGCNKSFNAPTFPTINTCQVTNSNCSIFNLQVQPITGKYNPEYSKLQVSRQENGSIKIIDNTPGSNRLIEIDKNGTGYSIDNNGNKTSYVNGDETTIHIGDDRIIIKGKKVIEVQGDYNLHVRGNYDLRVDGEFHSHVTKQSSITYQDEANIQFKNSAKLSAGNGLGLYGSTVKIGGNLEAAGGNFTTLFTEQNHTSIGSHNTFATFQNIFVTLNKIQNVGGFYSTLTAGNSNHFAGVNYNISSTGATQVASVANTTIFSTGPVLVNSVVDLTLAGGASTSLSAGGALFMNAATILNNAAALNLITGNPVIIG